MLNDRQAAQLKKLEEKQKEKEEAARQEEDDAPPSFATYKEWLERKRDVLEREDSDDMWDRWVKVEENAGSEDFDAGDLSRDDYHKMLVKTFADEEWTEKDRRWMEQLMQLEVNADVALEEFRKKLDN